MLSQDDVDRVKELLAKGELSHRAIAKLVGCSRGTVLNISEGRFIRVRDERASESRIPYPPIARTGSVRRCSEGHSHYGKTCYTCYIRAMKEGDKRLETAGAA